MAARREQPFASLSAADAHPRLSTHHNELENALVSSPHTFGSTLVLAFLFGTSEHRCVGHTAGTKRGFAMRPIAGGA